MNFILIGDLHFSLTSSSSRLDNITLEFEERFEKLKEIIKEHKVEAVICTGDIFNTPYQSAKTIFELSELIQSLEVPFITIIGNHDEIGYRLEGWHTSTSLGLLSAITSNLKVPEGPIWLSGVHITGSHYVPGIDEKNEEGVYIHYIPQVHNGFHLHIVHGYMVDGTLPFHTVKTTEIANTPADFILAGHYHQPVYNTIGEKTFYNPGSFANLTHDDKDRVCEVGLLTVRGDQHTLKRIAVPYGKAEWVIKTTSNFKATTSTLEQVEVKKTDSIALISEVAKTKEIQKLTVERYWEAGNEQE